MELIPNVNVEVGIEGRRVCIQAWRYLVRGANGDDVAVYFLDADMPDNDPQDRALTGFLYGGDQRYRLCQEALLGLGGTAMVRALGYRQIETFHMNEGHSALLTLSLLEEACGTRELDAAGEDEYAMPNPSLCASMRPSCSSTSRLASARPMPSPLRARLAP